VDANGPFTVYAHSAPRFRSDGSGIVFRAQETRYDENGTCTSDITGFAETNGGGDVWLRQFTSTCDAAQAPTCTSPGVSAGTFELGGPWPATGSDPALIAYDETCSADTVTITAKFMGSGSDRPIIPGAEAELAGGWTPDGRVLVQKYEPEGLKDYLVSTTGQATPWTPPNPAYARTLAGCFTEVLPSTGVVFAPDGELSGWTQGAPETPDAPSPACPDRHAGIWLADASGANPHQVIEDESASLNDIQCTPGNCLQGIVIDKDFGPGTAAAAFPATFAYAGAVTATRLWQADPFTPPYADPLLLRVGTGPYDLTESEPPGWALTAIRCSGADFAADVATGSVTVTLTDTAGLAQCVFTSDWDGVTAPQPVPTAAPSPTPGGCSGDSDGDGYCDEIEAAYGSDPNLAASYPVTPPGYWGTHDKMGSVPPRRCDAGSVEIDPCILQPGDVVVVRHVDNTGLGAVQNLPERFFGDTFYTHALLFLGFWELSPSRDHAIQPAVLDITPGPAGRSEMAISAWDQTIGPEGPGSAAAVHVFRSGSRSLTQREGFGRTGLRIAWDLGASSADNHDLSSWNAPSAEYAHLPNGWGPTRYYCSSLVATAYGWGFDDFHRPTGFLAHGDPANYFVTPDDVVEQLPDMQMVRAATGQPVGFGPDGRGFSLWSPADLLLTDPQGLRTGRDADGTVYEEIEGANWRLNDDNESVTAPLVTDDWVVTVSGTGEGDYQLVTHAIGVDPGTSSLLARTTRPGQIDTFMVGDLAGLGREPSGLPVEPSDASLAASGDVSLGIVAVLMVVLIGLVVVAFLVLRMRRGAALAGVEQDPGGVAGPTPGEDG
jgi:hypothetical protein